MFDYTDLKTNYISKNGYTRFENEVAGVPYLYNEKTKVMISYDDAQSMQLKAKYIIDQGLGGAMFWEFSSDRTNELLGSVYNTLNLSTVHESK